MAYILVIGFWREESKQELSNRILYGTDHLRWKSIR